MVEIDMPGGINTPLLGQYESSLAQMPDEKRAHCLRVIQALMDCYNDRDKKAVLLFSEEIDEPDHISVMAINADPWETEVLIDMLCVYGKVGSDHLGHLMN
jgi:hypothetical protein